MIYNLGLRFFNDREEAADFTHEVYLRAFDKYATFRGQSSFSTWIYAIAKNHGLNLLRKGKRKRQSHHFPIEIADTRSGPAETLADKQITEIINEELNKMPDRYRLPLVLFYYEKMDYPEMADYLQINESTLRSRVHRGKLYLRKAMIRRGFKQ